MNDNNKKKIRLEKKGELVKDYEKVIEEIKELAKENHNDLESLYNALNKYPSLKSFIGQFLLQFNVEIWRKEDEWAESMKQLYNNIKQNIRPAGWKSLLYCLNCQTPITPSKGIRDTYEKLQFSLEFRNAEKLKELMNELKSPSENNATFFQLYKCENHNIIMVEKFDLVPKK
jgi:hypothetical protein